MLLRPGRVCVQRIWAREMSTFGNNLIERGRAEPQPKMSLSSDIARGNTERLAGRKGSANLPTRYSLASWLYCSNNRSQFMKPRREMRHHFPALEENNPSPSHRQ